MDFFRKKENIYAVAALIGGLFLLFLIPPFQVPDEEGHHQRAWEVASGHFLCSENKRSTIPYSAQQLPANIKENGSFDGSAFIPSAVPWKNVANIKPDFRPVEVGMTNFCGTNPIGYVPAAIGLDMGRFLNLPAIHSFYLGRLISLIVSIFLVYWAVRLAPFGKNIFMFVGLFPMALQQFASLSYDASSISLGLFFLAYALKLGTQKNIENRQWIFAFIISMILLSIKPGYYAFCGLIFLWYPMYKDRPKIFVRNTALFLLGSVMVALLNYHVFKAPEEIWPYRVMPDTQMSFVLHHPMHFLSAVSNTLDERGMSFLTNMIGKLGPLLVDMPDTVLIGAFILIFIILRGADDEKFSLSRLQRLILLSIFVVNVLFVFLIIYVIWTAVSDDEVVGVQGRYFISSFPLLLFAFYGVILNREIRRRIVVIGCILLLFFGIFSAYEFYYEKGRGTYREKTSDGIVPEAIMQHEEKTITQTLVAKEKNLSKIYFIVADNEKMPKIKAELKDALCEKVLRRDEVSFSKDNDLYVANFGVIPESYGTKYCLVISTASRPIEVEIVAGNAYEGGELLNSDDKDLRFEIEYKK